MKLIECNFKIKSFENVENLGGKAWQHAMNVDLIEQMTIKDCSLHCFHYQQVFNDEAQQINT